MQSTFIVLIFFFYGLAFFSMGLVITQEVGRCSDARLRRALWFLSAFGLIHGVHEWIEMFHMMQMFSGVNAITFEIIRIGMLGLSFISLAAFGSLLLSQGEMSRRLVLLIPLTMGAIWSFGLLTFLSMYPVTRIFWSIMDVWTRYMVAIPAALLACAGLIMQQREFRRVGMAQFGRDSLWAAIAFAWYGLIGQIFTRPSPLFPSNFLNSELFFDTFGFPIQLLRAMAAVLAAVFVIRFLRAFEVETQHQIAELQAARLEEATRREIVAGELLHRVVQAQEAERQRVARELHDETGQALTAIGMGLRGAATILHQDADKAATNLRQLEGLVAASLNELQRLIADLRPSHLDDLGLPAALRWYCTEIQNRLPIKVSVEMHGETKDLPPEVKILLFRVAQEALTNVIKHADASQACVRLFYEDELVELQVEDNGRGIEPGILKNPQRPSWGLLGMEERATLLGGDFTIESRRGRGTLVQVTVPISDTKEVMDEDPVAVGG
jgi:signal transduction histidine kinase